MKPGSYYGTSIERLLKIDWQTSLLFISKHNILHWSLVVVSVDDLGNSGVYGVIKIVCISIMVTGVITRFTSYKKEVILPLCCLYCYIVIICRISATLHPYLRLNFTLFKLKQKTSTCQVWADKYRLNLYERNMLKLSSSPWAGCATASPRPTFHCRRNGSTGTIDPIIRYTSLNQSRWQLLRCRFSLSASSKVEQW